jgi:hypothetical protein
VSSDYSDTLLERNVPRIARVLFGIGDEVVRVSVVTAQVVERSHAFQPTITKRSGSCVSQMMFRDGSHAHISACLYSDAHVFGCGSGQELVLLHNPAASNPMLRGTVKRGRECWVQGDELICCRHDSP